MERHFRAPWSNLVTAVTAGIVLLFGGIIYVTPTITSILIGIAVIGGSALFMVRGYTIKGHRLLVHRLGWDTTYDLNDLEKAEVNRNVMKGSWRMFGIGGLFGFIGSYRNSELGNYRAYATHRLNCVVLSFDAQTVVVTPGAPQDFVDAVHDAADI